MSQSVLDLIYKYSAPAPERKYGVWWSLGGFLLLIVAGNFWVAAIALRNDFWIKALVNVSAIVAMFAAGALVYHSKRLLVPLAEEILDKDERKPVLYLRPFGIDARFDLGEVEHVAATPGGPSFYLTRSRVEDCLSLLNAVGPLIAIGKPGALPQTGAYRLYVSDAQWQEAISDLLPHAKLVVMSWGQSLGIEWELKEALRRVKPPSILFYLPFEDEAQYAQFKQVLQSHIPCKLPECKGNAYFLGFTSNTAPFLSGPGEHKLSKNDPHTARTESLKNALKRLYPNLNEKSEPVSKLPRISFITSISFVIYASVIGSVFYTLLFKKIPFYMPLAEEIVDCLAKY